MTNQRIAKIVLMIQVLCLILSLNGIGNPFTNALAFLGVIPVLYFDHFRRLSNFESYKGLNKSKMNLK